MIARVRWRSKGRFFHGYYDHYCYLPRYVFCGRHLLVSYLRSSKIDPARHSGAILSLLVEALRRHWPRVEIIFRGDGGFCRRKLLRWCERHDVRCRQALRDTVLANASPNRIRLTLLRIGAVVIRNTRRIRILMSSACPHQELFRTVCWRLNSS